MVLNNLTVLTHTHTDCSDLWDIYFDSYDNFFKDCNHLVIVNEKTSLIKIPQIIYNDNEFFSERLLKAIKKIESEYVLFSLEDMFLYDFVKQNELKKLLLLMENNPNISFVRLIKSGVKSEIKLSENIFKLDQDKDFLFSITPTIWRVEFLINVLQNLPLLNIWDLETYANNFLKNDNTLKLYYYNNDKPRGGHYDSSIYPHICSAIFKGKWNLGEYKELIPILEKYQINVETRGIFRY